MEKYPDGKLNNSDEGALKIATYIKECAKHIWAWLRANDKINGVDDVSLVALANGELRPAPKVISNK
jgi:hypothetical protein